jgi:hypothetical protein
VTLCGSRTILTPGQQAAWRGWGLSLISVALVAFGLVSFQLIHTSPRPLVEGNLWDVREEFEYGTTRFMITDATGRAVMILCSHRGPGFVQGERARVRYVAYNNKLVEMDMLSERTGRGICGTRRAKRVAGLGWLDCLLDFLRIANWQIPGRSRRCDKPALLLLASSFDGRSAALLWRL